MNYKREHQWNAKWKAQEMTDRDDTYFWLGQPINAMTRKQLQDALIECKLALLLKQNEVIKLRHQLESRNAKDHFSDYFYDECNSR